MDKGRAHLHYLYCRELQTGLSWFLSDVTSVQTRKRLA